MVKRLAIDGYAKMLHSGKIRFTPLARFVYLREIHFLTGAMQSPPQSDPSLKSPQLPILVFAGFFTLEGFEKCLSFETWVGPEKILDPMPVILIEWVLSSSPGMKDFALAG
jgi:hypothetical protein